jgi:hypothetical protein
MRTLAAAWGYLGAAAPIEEWGADAIVHGAADVWAWVQTHTNANAPAAHS